MINPPTSRVVVLAAPRSLLGDPFFVGRDVTKNLFIVRRDVTKTWWKTLLRPLRHDEERSGLLPGRGNAALQIATTETLAPIRWLGREQSSER